MEGLSYLESLPMEILNNIASYLSVKDLLACCGTSSLMRQAFSDGLVWKKHCNTDLISYLKQNERVVEPDSEWMDYDERTLSPLSKWREAYMMQTQLFMNWRHGRYEKEVIEFGANDVVYSETKTQFIENDYLFLHSKIVKNNKKFNEIWDVKGTPFLHTIMQISFDIVPLLREGDDAVSQRYVVAGNKLVVDRFNLVLIYDVTLSSYSPVPLESAFIFDKSEKESKNQITSTDRRIVMRSYYEPPSSINTIVSGKYFIGIIKYLQDFLNPVIHIWDTQTGKKIKDDVLPTESPKIMGLQLLASTNEKDLVIKSFVSNDRHTHHYYGYDLAKLGFSTFSLKSNYCDVLIFAGNCVIGAGPQTLYIYSYTTSEKLLTKKCNHQILKKTFTVVGDNLLFGTFDSIVQVINLTDLTLVNSVKLGFTLYSLQAICNRFVIVNTTNSEVWEIGKVAKKLFKFPIDSSFSSINEHCSKIALEKGNKIIILNFW